MRLDFETFVITGPSTGESTEAANAGKGLFGKPNEYIYNFAYRWGKKGYRQGKNCMPQVGVEPGTSWTLFIRLSF